MTKQSPLQDLHRKNGAIFREEDSWSLPIHFGDPLQEHRSVRSHAGLLDLCHRSVLRFAGPDRVSYLQGMVSNDVERLTPGEGTNAAILDVQGKILADTRIFCMRDCFLLDLWESLKDKILAHLNRYLVADDVEITDLAGQYGVVSLQGPYARPFLSEIFPHHDVPARQLGHERFQLGDAEIQIVRFTHTGEDGYDLFIEIDDLLPVTSSIWESRKNFPLRWVGTQAQEVLRIESGIPRYGIDMSEDNLLLETGLDRAVSFQKGCYLGQEVVERIRSRGHVNKRLVGLILDGNEPAERGSVIRVDDKEIGKVTSSVISPVQNRPVALGYVHREYIQTGTPLTIQSRAESIPAVVSPLPFYRSTTPLESA